MSKLLIVDDEKTFRTHLAARLKKRGYDNIEVSNGEDAIKAVRADEAIDVVLLDRKMPGMAGEQVLEEIRTFRPALQVIMLTGHGSMESAMQSGRLEAYAYLTKPCEIEELLAVIDRAREDRVHKMARHEIPHAARGSWKRWLKGSHNSRPGLIIFGLLLFAGMVLMPAPDRLMELLSAPKTGELSDANMGYTSYRKMEQGQTIADYYSRSYKIGDTRVSEDGHKTFVPLSARDASRRAQVMLAILVIAALFWATGAVPVGITALLVGTGMYFLDVLKPDDIAQAYAKDAVVFIFGVLAMSLAISKTGLDRRIGLLLMGPAKSRARFLFIFLPLLGMACSFVSEHALIAFLMPLIMMVYISTVRAAGLKQDKALAVMFVLSMCYVANCGGPGSPAAGGRNAVMLGIMADYGVPPTFGQWVMYGFPFVPVMALVIGAYFYFVFRKKTRVEKINVSALVRQASDKIGPMNRDEYVTAGALVGLILLWVLASDRYGMGGPVLLVLVFLNIARVIRWRDI
ncbi:MAG: SLC13 family permease, partial [Pseudomonadota bacterium]